MAVSCPSCSSPVNEDVYKCAGVCNASYHVACIGINDGALAELLRPESQTLWMCRSCMNLRCTGKAASLDSITDTIAELKSELLQEFDIRLSRALDAVRLDMSSKLDRVYAHTHSVLQGPTPTLAPTTNLAAVTPLSSRLCDTDRASQNAPPRNAPKRRLVDFTPPAPEPAASLQLGTAPVSPSSRPVLTVPIVETREAKFWLYLTRIAPSVTELDIREMVRKQLDTDDVIIFKLLPRDRDVSTLTFISFKVGMSLALRERALSASTWHRGIVYREFTDHRVNTAQNFWRPAHHVPPALTFPHESDNAHITQLQPTIDNNNPPPTNTISTPAHVA